MVRPCGHMMPCEKYVLSTPQQDLYSSDLVLFRRGGVKCQIENVISSLSVPKNMR